MGVKGHRPPRSTLWVDIDNPPQAQYLLPFATEFERRGRRVLVTVRRHGIAQDLVRQRGVDFVPVGASSTGGTARKIAALTSRATELGRLVHRERPVAAVFASRSAAVTSTVLRVPAFALIDYEHVDLRAFRFTRTTVVHPRIIEGPLIRAGIPRGRLLGYDGIKEHISCADVDLEALEPLAFDGAERAHRTVLVRPPDENSHYFSEMSRSMTRALMKRLACEQDVTVILSPRHPHQRQLLEGLDWRRAPVVLDAALPFDRLLASVDAVVTAGGTMAREAAFLGVPAYSVFQGTPGMVDLHLESTGRLTMLRTPEDVERLAIAIARRPRIEGESPVPGLVDEILARSVEL